MNRDTLGIRAKFTVPIEIDFATGLLEIIPTETMKEWLNRTEIVVKEIKLDQQNKPPYWHQNI